MERKKKRVVGFCLLAPAVICLLGFWYLLLAPSKSLPETLVIEDFKNIPNIKTRILPFSTSDWEIKKSSKEELQKTILIIYSIQKDRIIFFGVKPEQKTLLKFEEPPPRHGFYSEIKKSQEENGVIALHIIYRQNMPWKIMGLLFILFFGFYVAGILFLFSKKK